jgi:hypothetical protein
MPLSGQKAAGDRMDTAHMVSGTSQQNKKQKLFPITPGLGFA